MKTYFQVHCFKSNLAPTAFSQLFLFLLYFSQAFKYQLTLKVFMNLNHLLLLLEYKIMELLLNINYKCVYVINNVRILIASIDG